MSEDALQTMPFDEFWAWAQTHPNCILRAGTSDAILFDDEDFHWHFGMADRETLLLQVIRGKRLIGELVIRPAEVAYVHGVPGDHEDEYLFELVPEPADQGATHHIVMSHGFDDEPEPASRWTH